MRHRPIVLNCCCTILFSIGATMFVVAVNESRSLGTGSSTPPHAAPESSSLQDLSHRADYTGDGAIFERREDSLRVIDEENFRDETGTFEV